MNRTRIEWADYTWNPFVGCKRKCPWCYGLAFAKRNLFKCDLCRDYAPHFHLERFSEPQVVKKPSRIFVCSMGDLFGEGMSETLPNPWASMPMFQTIMYAEAWAYMKGAMRAAPWHKFLLLTKSPENVLAGFNDDLSNLWIGVSETYLPGEHPIGGTQPDAAINRCALLSLIGERRFVSFEPLCGEPDLRILNRFNWVIVGAMTGRYARQHPTKPKWVQSVIDHCRDQKIPLFLKNNLHWPETIQEYPAGLKL